MSTPDLPDTTDLIASLLSLMTSFSCLGCPSQAVLIRHELALLQSYPDSHIPRLLKDVAKRLEGEWIQLHFAITDDPIEDSLSKTQNTASHRALH